MSIQTVNQFLHILRINGIAQSFYTNKDNALKELVRTHLSGVPNVSVESIQSRGTEGAFDRGVEVFLGDVQGYMKKVGIEDSQALLNPALLYPCLMIRRTGASSSSDAAAFTPLTRDEVDALVAQTYATDAGEGIHKPIRPDTRPPLRPLHGAR